MKGLSLLISVYLIKVEDVPMRHTPKKKNWMQKYEYIGSKK